MTAFLRALAVAALVGTAPLTASGAAARSESDPAIAGLRSGFASQTVKVNGTTLHFVRGGRGPAVILLHGFPQDWYAWHRVMPRLARTSAGSWLMSINSGALARRRNAIS